MGKLTNEFVEECLDRQDGDVPQLIVGIAESANPIDALLERTFGLRAAPGFALCTCFHPTPFEPTLQGAQRHTMLAAKLHLSPLSSNSLTSHLIS
jgi:hypothetical protein